METKDIYTGYITSIWINDGDLHILGYVCKNDQCFKVSKIYKNTGSNIEFNKENNPLFYEMMFLKEIKTMSQMINYDTTDSSFIKTQSKESVDKLKHDIIRIL